MASGRAMSIATVDAGRGTVADTCNVMLGLVDTSNGVLCGKMTAMANRADGLALETAVVCIVPKAMASGALTKERHSGEEFSSGALTKEVWRALNNRL